MSQYDGPYRDEVLELLTLRDGGFAMARSPDDSIGNATFCLDLERCFSTAFDQEYEPLIELGREGREDLGAIGEDTFADGIRWQDLRSNMVAKSVWTRDWHVWARGNRNLLDPLESETAWRELGNIVLEAAPSLGEDDAYTIGEDLESILGYVAESRAYRGKTGSFYETLFDFVSRGFWPCGYEGVWPNDGKYVLWYAG